MEVWLEFCCCIFLKYHRKANKIILNKIEIVVVVCVWWRWSYGARSWLLHSVSAGLFHIRFVQNMQVIFFNRLICIGTVELEETNFCEASQTISAEFELKFNSQFHGIQLTIYVRFVAIHRFPAVRMHTYQGSMRHWEQMRKWNTQSIVWLFSRVNYFNWTHGFSIIAPSRSTITEWSCIFITCRKAPIMSWDLSKEREMFTVDAWLVKIVSNSICLPSWIAN